MPSIRPMTFEELCQQVEWARQEGWEPGQDDASLFWNLDPGGFLALELENRFIGGGAVIRHSSSFGFMGLFIVEPSHRGKGYGKELWYARRDHLLSRLESDACIGLDGVYDMVPFYEEGGFKSYSYHRRFMLPMPLATGALSSHIVELSSVDRALIHELDLQCFPADRSQFLDAWINQTSAVAIGYKQDGRLRGMGVFRPGTTGWRLAPLFADSIEVADSLFQAFQKLQGERPIYLDVPDNNPAAADLKNRYDMQEVFGCVRMYYGNPPKIDSDKVFGVTTFEVG